MFIYFKTRQLIRAMCHDSLFEQCAMITFSSNRLRAIGNRHSMNWIFEGTLRNFFAPILFKMQY